MTDKPKENMLAQFVLPERLDRLDTVLEKRTDELTVVLDNIRNYHNISAVIRSADAFGLSEIHLVGKGFDYNKGISLGAERWLELTPHDSAEQAIDALIKDGYKLVVLQPEGFSTADDKQNSIPISKLPFEQKLALVFGNENRGVNQLFIEKADYFAFIPMAGFVESLNVSVACAIALFCSTIPEVEPTRRARVLSDTKRMSLREDWLKKDVRGSEIILREIEIRNKSQE